MKRIKLFESFEDSKNIADMIMSDIEETNIDTTNIRILPAIFETDTSGLPVKNLDISYYGMANYSLYNVYTMFIKMIINSII